MTDSELLGWYIKGESEEAFARIVTRYTPLVYSTCLRRLGNKADAEDATQVAFLVLVRKARTIRKSSSLPAWLYRVADLSALQMRRDRSSRQRHEGEAAQMKTVHGTRDSDQVWEQIRPVLDDAIGSLPERYRGVLVSRYLAGQSEREVAQELGKPVGTVKSRLSRAVAMLRIKLAARGMTTISGALLVVFLSRRAVAGVPEQLAGSICAVFTVHAAASTITVSIAEGVMKAMKIAKMKIAAVVVALLLAAGTGTVVLVAQVRDARTLAPATPADRGATVKIGTLEVPADCPLALKEHPRLLFTKKDLPRLRERLKIPVIAETLKTAEENARKGKADMTLLGVLYQVTGRAEYARTCKEMLLKKANFSFPSPSRGLWAYDLVYETLSSEERRLLEDRMAEAIRKIAGRHPEIAFTAAIALYGDGVHDDFAAEMIGKLYPAARSRLDGFGVVASPRGGTGSFSYTSRYTLQCAYSPALALTVATGEDWGERDLFVRYIASCFLYHTRPHIGGTVHIGLSRDCLAAPTEAEAGNLVYHAAARLNDGMGSWFCDQLVSTRVPAWRAVRGLWGRLLWYDPARDIEPEKFPPARFFAGMGYAVMRSDWTKDATFAHFQCGRFEGGSRAWGRSQADNLSFIIHKKGSLAIDSGGVHGLDCALMKLDGGYLQRDDNPQTCNYARQTVAHNSITVSRHEIKGPAGNALRGGQVPVPAPRWLKQWGVPAGTQIGRIVAYETNPVFDYACGEATSSYSPDYVKSITRQFVYLRPDTFVIFDRVVSTKPDYEKIWMLHCLDEPTSNGREQADPAWTPEKQRIARYSKEKKELYYLPNPHPGGHFLLSGDALTVDDTTMTGRLFSRTLLPREGNRVVRKIGGPWHDFEVNGVNYGPTEDSYKLDIKKGYWRHNTCGLAGWRIEVEPKEKRTDDVFLHVLHACDQTVKQMVPTELIERGNRVGAKVTVGTKVYEVTFNKTGKTGGYIRVTDAAKVIHDRDLVERVEDNYSGWKDDPRYKEWMTNPYMRTVIGEKEQDEYRARQEQKGRD